MKRNFTPVLMNGLIMMIITFQLVAAEPDRDGGKKGKSSHTESYRIETGYYTGADLHSDLEKLEPRDVRNHPVNWDVALRKQLFEDTYTFYTEAAPGEFSDSKEIRKPVIYNSVLRIDRHYRKLLRTGEMDSIRISEQFCSLLDKAIILYHYDTEEFEAGLKRSKTPEAMIQTFSMLEFANPSATR